MKRCRTKSGQYSDLPVSKSAEKNFLALIIDDEADICFLLKEILHNKKIKADYVTTLAGAEEFLQTHDPYIIFLDNQLTDGLGIERIQRFKQQKPNTKIVLITAHDTLADKEKAYKEGADHFISKPFSRKDILETVDYPD